LVVGEDRDPTKKMTPQDYEDFIKEQTADMIIESEDS